jgi:hypothetical protein
MDADIPVGSIKVFVQSMIIGTMPRIMIEAVADTALRELIQLWRHVVDFCRFHNGASYEHSRHIGLRCSLYRDPGTGPSKQRTRDVQENA